MGHHGSDPFDHDPKKLAQMQKLMAELKNTTSFRGALGEFPEGKVSASDEGAIQFGVTTKDGKVILDFGTPVAWVGMNPQDAADLASVLLKNAREAGRQRGEVVTIKIG